MSFTTPSLHAIGRVAERAGEVAKYLAGLDPLGRLLQQLGGPNTKIQKFVLELFVRKACLSVAVLKRKLNGGAPMDAAHGFGKKRFGGII